MTANNPRSLVPGRPALTRVRLPQDQEQAPAMDPRNSGSGPHRPMGPAGAATQATHTNRPQHDGAVSSAAPNSFYTVMQLDLDDLAPTAPPVQVPGGTRVQVSIGRTRADQLTHDVLERLVQLASGAATFGIGGRYHDATNYAVGYVRRRLAEVAAAERRFDAQQEQYRIERARAADYLRREARRRALRAGAA